MNPPTNQSSTAPLSIAELQALIQSVFTPRAGDTGIALLVDLPDTTVRDDPAWKKRRLMALSWAEMLDRSELGLDCRLFLFQNVRMNNADLPEHAWEHREGPLPERFEDLDPTSAVALDEVLARHSILLAPTRVSATAPLKLAAPRHGFRAATMPGLNDAMIPALRLDYEEVDRRVRRLKELLDRAHGADLRFLAAGRRTELHLDLRFRQAHASGGLLREPGTAGNLPSGESYIVPYEGERPGEPSRSAGVLPVELEGEVVFYSIRANRAVAVEAGGRVAKNEAALLEREPAYGNLAELGLGVLADLGVRPIGEILLDEKLGLHIAFGRSDHFGGQVGSADFSQPSAVVHIDRVYLPETQPRVRVEAVDLSLDDGSTVELMRDGRYVWKG